MICICPSLLHIITSFCRDQEFYYQAKFLWNPSVFLMHQLDYYHSPRWAASAYSWMTQWDDRQTLVVSKVDKTVSKEATPHVPKVCSELQLFTRHHNHLHMQIIHNSTEYAILLWHLSLNSRTIKNCTARQILVASEYTYIYSVWIYITLSLHLMVTISSSKYNTPHTKMYTLQSVHVYTGWAKKTGLFLTVCNSRICWHRIAFYTSNCSVFCPE